MSMKKTIDRDCGQSLPPPSNRSVEKFLQTVLKRGLEVNDQVSTGTHNEARGRE